MGSAKLAGTNKAAAPASARYAAPSDRNFRILAPPPGFVVVAERRPHEFIDHSQHAMHTAAGIRRHAAQQPVAGQQDRVIMVACGDDGRR